LRSARLSLRGNSPFQRPSCKNARETNLPGSFDHGEKERGEKYPAEEEEEALFAKENTPADNLEMLHFSAKPRIERSM